MKSCFMSLPVTKKGMKMNDLVLFYFSKSTSFEIRPQIIDPSQSATLPTSQQTFAKRKKIKENACRKSRALSIKICPCSCFLKIVSFCQSVSQSSASYQITNISIGFGKYTDIIKYFDKDCNTFSLFSPNDFLFRTFEVVLPFLRV